MSLAESIVLDDQSGDDVTYKKTRSDSSGSSYIDTSTTLTEPAQLVFKHSVNGKGSEAVDRHLVQFSRTKLNTAGVPRTLTCNFTIAVPRDVVITSTIVKDQIANLVDFLADGAITSIAAMTNVDALLRGEA